MMTGSPTETLTALAEDLSPPLTVQWQGFVSPVDQISLTGSRRDWIFLKTGVTGVQKLDLRFSDMDSLEYQNVTKVCNPTEASLEIAHSYAWLHREKSF